MTTVAASVAMWARTRRAWPRSILRRCSHGRADTKADRCRWCGPVATRDRATPGGRGRDGGNIMVKYEDVTVKLVGEDGNAFNLIGLVNRGIRDAHGADAAKEFTDAAMGSESYDALLSLIQETVHVI